MCQTSIVSSTSGPSPSGDEVSPSILNNDENQHEYRLRRNCCTYVGVPLKACPPPIVD